MIFGHNGRTIPVISSLTIRRYLLIFSLQLDHGKCCSMVDQRCSSSTICRKFSSKSIRWSNDPTVNSIGYSFHSLTFFDHSRLAANEKHYIPSIMHIRDVRDKRRLVIKATDVVLFGPPQGLYRRSSWNDQLFSCRIAQFSERYDSYLRFVCFDWWMYLCISSTTTNTRKYEYYVERIGNSPTSRRKSHRCDREVKHF